MDLKIIEIIITGISGLGSLLIATLAFRLSRRDKLILLKSNLSLGIISNGKENIQIFHLYIANIGTRVVRVNGIKWVYRPFCFKKKINVKEFEYHFSELNKFSTQLPVVLRDGEEINIYYPKDFFQTLQIDSKLNQFIFSIDKYKTWYRIHTFKIVISTTADDNIPFHVPWKFRRFLWTIYKNLNHKLPSQ